MLCMIVCVLTEVQRLMSRKNKPEKACSPLWKDQSTMAAVAKQKTAQEGHANQGSGDTTQVHHRTGQSTLSHDQHAVAEPGCHHCRPVSVVSSLEVEASGDMTVQVCEDHARTDGSSLSADVTKDESSMHSEEDVSEPAPSVLSCQSCDDQTIPPVDTPLDTQSHDQQTLPELDTREAGGAISSQNCSVSGHSDQRSLTSAMDTQHGSGSIPPIFELEYDGNEDDDDVFDTSCHGDNDYDEHSPENPEHLNMTHGSQPVDIPRLALSPYGSTHASPDTRVYFTPPGGSMPSQHRFRLGSIIYRGGSSFSGQGGLSISGQSPLGPDNLMVHEALAWTQRLLSPLQQGQSRFSHI